MPTVKRIALVTGANRGLGLQTCRSLAEMGFQVVLTGRNSEAIQQSARLLDPTLTTIACCPLDVTQQKSVLDALDFVRQRYGRLDVLINNAGVSLDVDGHYEPPDIEHGIRYGYSIFNLPKEKLLKTLEVNTVGVMVVCQAFIPLMQANNYGRVVNVSSLMGQLVSTGTDWPAYRISKTALNAVTRLLAQEIKDTDILVNAVHPGWVQTDMGGPHAFKTVCEGVETILWAATLPSGGMTGGFFQDKQAISW